MAFRFWCRVRLAPGVTLNLSKSTASLSFGPRGAKFSVLRQLRYERAVRNDQVGSKAQMRRELGRVYAEDPSFEDVSRRLGLKLRECAVSQ